MKYSASFRAKMVSKMCGPGRKSASDLAEEVGMCQPTLSRWLRESGKVETVETVERPKSKRPKDWTSHEKLEVVLEAASLEEEQLGGMLRQSGLHQAQLEEWRVQMLSGLEKKGGKRKVSAEARRIRELERELRRKDKALAETAALLVLKKKALAIWGDGDESTPRRRGR